MLEAACLGMDCQIFYPSKGAGRPFDKRVETARAICGGCPVRQECAEFAYGSERYASVRFGIFGGLTGRERYWVSQEVRRTRRPADELLAEVWERKKPD